MAGLFDTLNLGARSLQNYRKAIDTAGHNLANANTVGYTRQRVEIESVNTVDALGPTGMGAEAVRVIRMHDGFIDKQLQSEASISGSLEGKEDGLRQALASLQETLDRTSANGTVTNGITQALNDFFGALQSLSNHPASIPERQVVMQKAQALAAKFNQTDSRLGDVAAGLNDRVVADVGSANNVLAEIARLNESIAAHEGLTNGPANDLRDARQTKLQELAKFVRFDAAEQPDGSINVVVGGQLLVDGQQVVATLETFDPGDSNLMVRVSGSSEPLALQGGSIQGTISVRDEEIATLRSDVNTLAAAFIIEVNRVHGEGYNLGGTAGAAFFNGVDASDIAVNNDLLRDPSLLQGSSEPGATGNGAVIISLARLQTAAQSALGGISFSEKQIHTITKLGQDLATTTRALEDQGKIETFVQGQRDALSGVSLDEEMANLVMFQKAFQASAKLISMTDEMLATIIQM